MKRAKVGVMSLGHQASLRQARGIGGTARNHDENTLDRHITLPFGIETPRLFGQGFDLSQTVCARSW
ncbi:MAG: hypothetical protein JNL04_21115 [Rhodospirillaceae bacterium]|nr:hypothetical protein [Rhodospirillaceae bacterium]